ncbi:50S ribosomal protein L11 methyltransferase [Falsigemmobacter faecalis]|uniref:Ribosomal protein L11 methyltransferase n=1 Tax=Falsigemmobacter faecalis TaxID=2488730 RepID=A0A3P3DIE5_9RHOB|nr:50S ribosomal protein L11 methyltransferase [Falsigemmobacter faecalis]RRH73486.1 50S ribosomal protein L11 methyltransferase [Falsigemmobacter faecalis]
MPSYSAITSLDGKEAADALAAALEKLTPEPYGVGVFEIEDGSELWEVGAYFTEAPNELVLDIIATAFGAKGMIVSEIPEIDWVAKVRRDLAPVEAGRFFLFGSHDIDKVPASGVIPLQIEATVAFGTGHHGTTLGCLKAVDRLGAAGLEVKNVADIGSGTGVLALAAARLWPEAQIIASDIDQVAVDVAIANAEINGLADRVPCVEAAGFDHRDLKARAPYDLIFANILKGPLVQLAPDMAKHAATGGHLILSGLLTVQSESILDAYVAQGFSLKEHTQIGEWSTLVLLRG